MPEPIISAEFLRELDASMANEVLNGRLPFQTLAQKVQSIGFISTRIFMLGRDDINDRTFFLPTYIHPKPERADYSECSLRTEDGFVEGKVKRVPPQVVRSVLSETDLECGLKKLHEELDIEGKFSYVTPIRRGEELIGKLSMTIDSDMDQLEASEDSALILMATLLEKYVTQYLDAKATQFQS